MGTYVNPGNGAFDEINNKDFVDKTLLIDLINKTISEKTNKLTCISRPRRFGKTYATKMLVAYYDCSCKSEALFNDKKIAKTKLYKEHMNKYNVIRLDISGFTSAASKNGISFREIPKMIEKVIMDDLIRSGFEAFENESLTDFLIRIAKQPKGKKFIFIIDEWDSVIREAKHDGEAQKRFLDLLREWFKNEMFTPDAVAAAYMTGILPIKKDEGQSAVSDFFEYSVLNPDDFAPFFGFDEEEVMELCDRYGMDFETVRKWYDGYTVGDIRSVYNPYSVMKAAKAKLKRYRSYWKKTSVAESLKAYIDMDMDGLQDAIAQLIVGEAVEVNTGFFNNDMETFTDKDDVLTLLIHLGYLSLEYEDEYEEGDESEDSDIVRARIPNKEVRHEFEALLRKARHKTLVDLVRMSDQLLKDVMAGREEDVAKGIQDVHDSHYAPTFYNHEQSLRSVIRLACISWVDQYVKAEELPSGHGVADVAFIPKKSSPLPGVIVELKWDKSEEGAIGQIKDRKYQQVLEQLGGAVVLVGVSYDSKDKTHTCRIERIGK